MMQRCTQGIELKTMAQSEAIEMAEFLKVFADADRIRILALLKDKEVCVSHIAKTLGKSISAVSHQLALMRSTRLVRYIKDGKNTYYTLDDDHVSQIVVSARDHIAHR